VQAPNLADGSAAGVDMELTGRLVEQLSLLALGAVRDGSSLVDDLTELVSTLSEAVSGYAGLRLTLVHSGQPIRLTSLPPVRAGHQVVSSLSLALRPVSDAIEAGGRLVVWSTVAGSLVDLAADLGYVFDDADGAGRAAASSVVRLDEDLPPSGTTSGLDGLDELATIHRAAGLLIARGGDPASVQETLRAAAADDGTSTSAWAARLLDRR
jgi:hypothetical protein